MTMISMNWRSALAASAIAAALAVSGCSSLAPAALQAPTKIERLPFPGMSEAQVKVYIACRLALGGNERRRQAVGEAKVAAALKACTTEFWKLDDWWPVYVKLWSVSGERTSEAE